ncbi:unnamed protein product [Prorocentrum cordatum]|uniref:Uncharacterized protein n=1 Tax=Prorocentrum cordatum TaxID=2364126 RepID=A0ABN9T456_9DINO|nr:unnamed protein product [Polarella glacialis]
MANVDSTAMFIAFIAWHRQPCSRRMFYAMRMDTIMTQIDHGAIGPVTDAEWVEDHYVPIRKVLCDGILCRWAEVAAIMGIEPPDGLDSASDVTVDMAVDPITDHVTASALKEALDPICEQADADDSHL